MGNVTTGVSGNMPGNIKIKSYIYTKVYIYRLKKPNVTMLTRISIKKKMAFYSSRIRMNSSKKTRYIKCIARAKIVTSA